MDIRIVHKAGKEFDELAERIGVLVEQAAPLVEEVTNLRLPESVVIRTMTWRKWHRSVSRRFRRELGAETGELRPSITAIVRAQLGVKAGLAALRTEWVGIGAETIDFRGQPEILVLPQALREAGRLNDDQSLLKVVAHELTHVAQRHHAPNAARLVQTRFPDERGVTDRDYSFLFEGHAYWADSQVTTKLLGAPVPIAEISPHSTLRYRAMAERPERAAALRHVETARDSVSAAISVLGLDRFNDVWRDRDLVPLKSETSTPDAWSQRLTDVKSEQSPR
ncbi:hypothetical protein ACFY2N_34320 [Streptomyces rubiginosohelvolus]|uniref:hypothetical protein n=1 Tax=Streptomyces rubiginosohelvolus TaxID=67362 RepID=UPI003685DCE3